MLAGSVQRNPSTDSLWTGWDSICFSLLQFFLDQQLNLNVAHEPNHRLMTIQTVLHLARLPVS